MHFALSEWEDRPLILSSDGGQEEEIIGNTKGRRGNWGDLWNEDEE